eukprot:5923855-Prymnesium_polylepis.3
MRSGVHKNRVAAGPGLTSSTPLSKMTAAVRTHGEQLLSRAVQPALREDMPISLAVSQLDPEVALYSDQVDWESSPGLQDQLYFSFVAYTDADPGVPYLWVKDSSIASLPMICRHWACSPPPCGMATAQWCCLSLYSTRCSLSIWMSAQSYVAILQNKLMRSPSLLSSITTCTCGLFVYHPNYLVWRPGQVHGHRATCWLSR